MGVRAGIVVTGTEVLTGRVQDRNGPWLAESLRQLGVDVGQIVVVGDREDDMRSALTFLAAGHDLVITSGGLGPTADDLTAQIVANVQGRSLRLDSALEERIGAIVAGLSARFGNTLDPAASAAGVRKQSMVPDGASVLEPTGTAPGLVVRPADGVAGPPVIVLPGPPRELQSMWPTAVADPVVAAIVARADELRQKTLRLWNVPESELAAMLRRSGSALDGLEITTCLSNGELEIVSRYAPAAEHAYTTLVSDVRKTFGDKLFSDGPTIDALTATELTSRGWTLGLIEVDMGGITTARLTSTLGGILLGGLVLSEHPAGGPEIADLANEAITRFGADVGMSIGRTADSVVISFSGPIGVAASSAGVRGPVQFVRERAAVLALHSMREWLTHAV